MSRALSRASSLARASTSTSVARVASQHLRDAPFSSLGASTPARASARDDADAVEKMLDEARASVASARDAARLARSEVTFEEEVLPALRRFYAERGHLNVPRSYVVPEDAGPHLAGYRLGDRVDRMRSRGDYVRGSEERMRALDAVGAATGETFAWDDEDWVFYKQVIPCLRYYVKAHEHANVPMAYRTPSSAEMYESTNALKRYNFGFALGKRVNDIRAKGTFIEGRPDRFDALCNLEFVWDDEEYNWWSRIVPALELFRSMHGHLHVPARFVLGERVECPVGAHDAVYVRKNLQGVDLGSAVAQLRRLRTTEDEKKRLSPSRVRHLERMGFLWDKRDYDFQCRLLPAIRHLTMTYGSLPKALTFRPNLDYILRKNAPKAIFDYPIVSRLLRIESGAYDFGGTSPADGVTEIIKAFKLGREAYDTTADPTTDPNYEQTRAHFALWLRRFYQMRTRIENRNRAGTAADEDDDVQDDELVDDAVKQ